MAYMKHGISKAALVSGFVDGPKSNRAVAPVWGGLEP